MKRMYKYPLAQCGDQTIALEWGAAIRALQMQGSTPCLWVEVDAYEKAKVERRFFMFGTGYDIPSGLSYIGTVQTAAGFVWHYYTPL